MTKELKDVNSIDISLTHDFKEDTFGDRLRKSRIESGMLVSEVAQICGVTDSIVSGYELNRYTPTRETLTLLSTKFDMDYLCMEGYTKLIYNYDEFLDKLKLWMNRNKYTRDIASNKLGVSRSLFRYWFNGGTISIGTYNKIKAPLCQYNLI